MMMTRMKKAGILVIHHSDDPRDDAASSCHAGTSKLKVPPCWENASVGMCRKYSIPAKVTVKKMTKKSYEWRIPSRSSSLTQHLGTLMHWQVNEKNLLTLQEWHCCICPLTNELRKAWSIRHHPFQLFFVYKTAASGV